MTDLRQRLEEAADDTSRPMRTDLGDLLARARLARRRDRARSVAVAVAATAVAVAVPFAAANLAGHSDRSARTVAPASRPPVATPTTDPSSASTTAALLTPRVIAQRCQDQVTRRTPDLPPRTWQLVYPDRTYAVGEVVALFWSREAWATPVLCLVPEAGHEKEPVPADAFLPRPDQHELIKQLCSQITPDSSQGTRLDLRRGTVVTAASSGGRVAAVVNLSGSSFACTLDGLANRWASGSLYPAQSPRRLVDTNVRVEGAALGVKSQGTPTAYYWGAGHLPKGAAAIVLDFKNRPDQRVDVTDGAYAYVVKQPGYGLDDWRTKVLTSSGEVMCTSTWSPDPRGYGCLEAR